MLVCSGKLEEIIYKIKSPNYLVLNTLSTLTMRDNVQKTPDVRKSPATTSVFDSGVQINANQNAVVETPSNPART